MDGDGMLDVIDMDDDGDGILDDIEKIDGINFKDLNLVVFVIILFDD